MQHKPPMAHQSGYLLVEWVIAAASLAGFALLLMTLLQAREPQYQRQQLQQQQQRDDHRQQQRLRDVNEQRWLLQMQQGPLG
ncbi:hypothetical protein PSI9734_00113 [Pseudidiomarina piscicola]|uniref:Uncharacterized protein n=1 Tax=Pseudidiomarina piscicola TaxID=2614830 RepID=A0A6S6WKS5_9GAMM|nr:hypothetical protein [Pseudidiomarina piscicola]CAB0149549.1 hypothetical protein PSI9734_00113 [Pseudidiomarina piscicola]VZT38997.1 hypothetical protein PSI9734_00113 [Pseudomonas aeruginosa]